MKNYIVALDRYIHKNYNVGEFVPSSHKDRNHLSKQDKNANLSTSEILSMNAMDKCNYAIHVPVNSGIAFDILDGKPKVGHLFEDSWITENYSEFISIGDYLIAVDGVDVSNWKSPTKLHNLIASKRYSKSSIKLVFQKHQV